MHWGRCVIPWPQAQELQLRCTDLRHRKGTSQAEGKIPAAKQRSALSNDFHPQQVPALPGLEHDVCGDPRAPKALEQRGR